MTELRQGPQYVGSSTSIGGTADLARDAGSCTCAADAEAPTQCRTVRLSTGSRVEKKTTNEHGGGAVHLSEYQNVIVSFECPCVIKKGKKKKRVEGLDAKGMNGGDDGTWGESVCLHLQGGD